MATFMYYPGHASAASVGLVTGDPSAQMMPPQPQQQGYAGQPHVTAPTNQAGMMAYGYFPPPVQGHHQPYYSQDLCPPPSLHHRHTSSYQLPPLGMFYNAPPAPILRPPVIQEPLIREEYVNGGVNQFLDYDLDMISDFVVTNAYDAFGTDPNTIFRETNSSQTVELFTKGVSSVLNATRLPSVTVLLALDILSKYVAKLPEGYESIGGNSVDIIYQNTMISFVLANKFNDDKTFTNKSWSQATGMSLSSINDYEREWLCVFDWKLFEDRFILYEEYAHSFEAFCQKKRCPSPPNLLPTPHTTDNYLSPPSGYQTPVHLNSSVYSSPCYYDEDKNDFCYNHHQNNMMNSPGTHLSPNSKTGFSGNRNFNYNFYNFAPMQPQLPPQPYLGRTPNKTWNTDETFNNLPNPNFGRLDNNYFCYSAVY